MALIGEIDGEITAKATFGLRKDPVVVLRFEQEENVGAEIRRHVCLRVRPVKNQVSTWRDKVGVRLQNKARNRHQR